MSHGLSNAVEFNIAGFSFKLPVPLESLVPPDWHCPSEQLLCVELFAGAAVLSVAMKEASFAVLPIDKTSERKPRAQLMQLDLTHPGDQEVVLHALCFGNVAASHLAPPCGTASQARNKPLPPHMSSIHSPPLRSNEHLLGLPDLRQSDRRRVATANILYAFTMLVVVVLHARSIITSIENPSSSYFWQIMSLFCESNPKAEHAWSALEDNHFQNCAFGADRNKWTCWRGTPAVFAALRKACPGNHSHKSWKPSLDEHGQPVFPTSQEAMYPKELCRQHAVAVKTECARRGAVFPASAFQPQQTRAEKPLALKSGVRSLPPVVSEYRSITHEPEPGDEFKQLTSLPYVGKIGEEAPVNSRFTAMTGKVEANNGKRIFGIYRTPIQFVEAALSASHPLDYAFPLPDPLLHAVAKIISDGPKLIAVRRKLALKQIQLRRQQLQVEEARLHCGLHPEVAKVLEGKNILLWKELADLTGFDDPTLFDEYTKGFSVTGPSVHSPQFPHGIHLAQRSMEDLKLNAVWLKRRAIGRCVSSGDRQMDEEVWEKTMAEQQNGWISGPYTEAEVDKMEGGKAWLATRRFGLQQPKKVRLIDDCLASGLNSAFAGTNKLTLMGVDALTSLVLCISKHVALGKGFSFILSTGKKMDVVPHPEWKSKIQLLGRTVDLESAYKQAAADPSQGWVKYIAVYNPKLQAPSFFSTQALMFGAVSSVFSFNRLSRSVWHIGCMLFHLPMANFYDDFPCLEAVQTAESGAASFEGLLRCLGWRFAESGDKATTFQQTFDVLGIRVDLSQSGSGHVTLSNKPSRVEKILETVSGSLDGDLLHPSLAATLHGQLNFAQSFYAGSSLKPVMSVLSEISNKGWEEHQKPRWAMAAVYLAHVFRTAEPRTISIQDVLTPVVIFSDGAWEPTSSNPAGAGLVFLDPVTDLKVVRKVIIPQELIDAWLCKGKQQIIAELELLPILAGLNFYLAHLVGRRVLWFVDNNSVRDMCIKGSTQKLSLFTMLAEVGRLLHHSRSLTWFSRGPSKSNIADFPSRGDCEEAARLIGGTIGAPLSLTADQVKLCTGATDFVQYMAMFCGGGKKGD